MNANVVAPSRAQVCAEIAILAISAALFIGAFRLRPGYVDVALGVIAAGLIALSLNRSRRIWAQQPTESRSARQHLHAAARSMLAFTALAVSALLTIGLLLGYEANGWSGAWSRIANWHLLLAVCLYFPWALLQQFVFQFYLLGRLLYVLPAWSAVGATAAAFSAVHYPRMPIMAVTAVAGVVWAVTYRRHRRLLPLAMSHAALGSAMHYWILGRDLLERWLAVASA